jgi:hypothetical protein
MAESTMLEQHNREDTRQWSLHGFVCPIVREQPFAAILRVWFNLFSLPNDDKTIEIDRKDSVGTKWRGSSKTRPTRWLGSI